MHDAGIFDDSQKHPQGQAILRELVVHGTSGNSNPRKLDVFPMEKRMAAHQEVSDRAPLGLG